MPGQGRQRRIGDLAEIGGVQKEAGTVAVETGVVEREGAGKRVRKQTICFYLYKSFVFILLVCSKLLCDAIKQNESKFFVVSYFYESII